MTLVLQPLSPAELAALAQGTLPADDRAATLLALVPQHVAKRALRLLADGHGEPWCSPFLMVRRPDGRPVGACGFKGPPLQRRVEIGYGVAADLRGQGHATAAVRLLLDTAFASGEVDEVVAEVEPANIASARVVAELGFVAQRTRVDEEGDQVVQWVALPGTSLRGIGARA
jgi:[ribosomal protein S5]-alanine N-acetyltransferase